MPRTLHGRSFFLIALLAAVLAGAAAAQQAQPQAEAKPLWEFLTPGTHGEGSLRLIEREGVRVPILTLVGDAEQRGTQYGTLCKDALLELSTWINKEVQLRMALLASGPVRQQLFAALPEDMRVETLAMQKASGMPLAHAEFLQVASDIFKAFGCSVVVADERGAGGEYFFGRNLDYQNFAGRFHETSLITCVAPEAGNRYCTVGFLGQVGVLSGINEHGLTMTVTEISDRGLEKGTPYMARYRELLRTCKTFDEALAKVRTQDITTNNSLVVADRQGKLGVFEQASETVTPRMPIEGTQRIWQTNHYCLEAMFPFEGRRNAVRPGADKPKRYDASSEGRFNIIERICAPAAAPAGKLTRAHVIEALAEANQGDATVQSMIFHPDSGAIEVAFGTPPTSRGVFVLIKPEELWTKRAGPAASASSSAGAAAQEEEY